MRLLTEKRLKAIKDEEHTKGYKAGTKFGWECARVTFNKMLAQYGIEIQMVTRPELTARKDIEEIMEKKDF